MTAFTRLGADLWGWAPFYELPDTARITWLALYTTSEAKRHAPGLWQGGIPAIADAARQDPDVVIHSIDKMLERDMVEYDAKTRVLRLCMLPDPGEYPSNGKVIRSWWTRFKSVPECGVRDAHVMTLRWIIDAGAKGRGIPPSDDHETAWRTTFGNVPIPASRQRGVRRLADSDTGTSVQPSLFGPPAASAVPSGNGMPISGDARYPQVTDRSVDNSASLRHPNKINSPETVSDTVSDTNRIPDPGSRIPESVSVSGEGGRGGGFAQGSKPTLTLVPPYTVDDVLRALAQGPWDPSSDKSHQEAVGALIPRWAAQGLGVDDFALLADYNRHSGRRWNARQLVGCDLPAEISSARRTIEWREIQIAAQAGKT